MASAPASTGSIVPHLMTTVMQLTPAELREFKRRFAVWQQENGAQAEEEAALVQACKLQLPLADARRFRKLIGKSEQGKLRPNELQEYRTLVRRAETLDSTRLAALGTACAPMGKTRARRHGDHRLGEPPSVNILRSPIERNEAGHC